MRRGKRICDEVCNPVLQRGDVTAFAAAEECPAHRIGTSPLTICGFETTRITLFAIRMLGSLPRPSCGLLGRLEGVWFIFYHVSITYMISILIYVMVYHMVPFVFFSLLHDLIVADSHN